VTFSIRSIGAALGERRIDLSESNPDAERTLQKTKTSVVYEASSSTAVYAIESCLEALQIAKCEPSDVDAMICVTQTPDNLLPGLSFDVCAGLNCRSSIFRLDLNDGCSGFVQALYLADQLPAKYGTVLVVCADRYRSKTRFDDSATRLLFSDGATATLLRRPGKYHIGVFRTFSEPKGRKALRQQLESSKISWLDMDGYAVFKLVKRHVVPEIQSLLEEGRCLEKDVRNYLCHQASGLVLDALEGALRASGRFPSNLAARGNLVSSSIPMLVKDCGLQEDLDSTVLVGFGVGFHVASVIISEST